MGRARLRYGFERKKQAYKNLFNFSTPFSFHVTIACIEVIALHHVSSKDMEFQAGSTKWIPKGNQKTTNPKGPNINWIPQSSL